MWVNIGVIPVNGIEIKLPIYQTEQSACADVEANFHSEYVDAYKSNNNKYKIPVVDGQINIPPGDRILVPTGIKLLIPHGYHVAVNPRSGLSLKSGLVLLNPPGTIDSDYTDEVYILMMNISSYTVKISHGDRIAQLEIVKHFTTQSFFTLTSENKLQAHKATSNRTGGIGSTGINSKEIEIKPVGPVLINQN